LKAFIGFALLMLLAAIATIVWPLLRPRRDQARRWGATTAVALALPAVAFLLYAGLSNWNWEAPANEQGIPPAVEQMVRNLETRLQGNPTDVAGWIMLGRSQFQLDRFPEAVSAYRRAYTLTQGQNVEAVLGLGEAMAFAEQGLLLGQAATLFEQAYALAPNHPKVLWYTGLVAYESGRLEVARDRWNNLIAREPPPEVKRLLQDKVIEIEAQLVRAGAATAEGPVVTVRVSIAPKLAAQVPRDAPLFVLVRSSAGGPPLAVTKRGVNELPATIELSDRDAMIAGRSLKDAGKVTVLARVARSGEPVARSGDLEGRVSYDVGSPAPVDLVIDSIVP
jgi:cytochrome c-type biogenesis protein CcmH